MKIKHWQGYGCVNAVRVKDKKHTLHIRVTGNHEYGIEAQDLHVYNWLIRKFDKSIKDEIQWYKLHPTMKTIPSYDYDKHEDVCDYYFDYAKKE